MQNPPASPIFSEVSAFDLIVQAASAFGAFHGASARSSGIDAVESGGPAKHDQRDAGIPGPVAALSKPRSGQRRAGSAGAGLERV